MRGYAREVAFCKIFAYIIAEDLDGDFSQFDKEKSRSSDRK